MWLCFVKKNRNIECKSFQIPFRIAKTQKSIPEEIREQLGIFESSVRLSVGLESIDDLIQDLEQALQKTYEEK